MSDDLKNPFDHGMFPTKWPKELVEAQAKDKESRYRFSIVAVHAFIEQCDDQAILDTVAEGWPKYLAEAGRIYYRQHFKLEDFQRMFHIIERRAEQIQRRAYRDARRAKARTAQAECLGQNLVTLH